MRFKLRFILFIAMWLGFGGVTQSQPFLKQIEKAAPAERIRLVLNYFDTCQVVLKNQVLALRTLAGLDRIGHLQHDSQLQRYAGMLRDTYGKNDQRLSHTQRAELFLRVAGWAVTREDEQIAGVCEHFAGQYYYLAQDYGLAFEYLLSANNRFQRLGYSRIPGIHRYLYELAFNYYYLNDDEKVIQLLSEARHYPPFNPNLHIQTYNTLAMAYARQSDHSPKAGSEALQNYQRAYQLAVSYRDSVWIGIINGNLGGAIPGAKAVAPGPERTTVRLSAGEAQCEEVWLSALCGGGNGPCLL